MSSKINIFEIVTGHFKTLKNTNDKYSPLDFITFVVSPLVIAALSGYLSFNLNKDLSSLLVNFGSIFTALLLSVLVLVYDQETKLEGHKENDGFYSSKKELMRQLYYNISYSILCSVILVLFCLMHSVVKGKTLDIAIYSFSATFKYDIYLITPIVVLITTNLFLNILMIVKRMHALLISQ